ncbi:MAG: transglycosylase [Desulfovibrio sp. MES5]|uniref:lytic murein transglycosylase n=1 Tax=Desulfovibrio sp. MES5 TaxID=1899016 RepID=UPI000B9CDF90|nr:lytic murein transglycosylase [Desulfovibrio sp. MES5]OXS28270.1 MAG: transglycosylase [Desulfovibrio sp. MES5]
MSLSQVGDVALPLFRNVWLICCLTCCMLAAACGGAHTEPVSPPDQASPTSAGYGNTTATDLQAKGVLPGVHQSGEAAVTPTGQTLQPPSGAPAGQSREGLPVVWQPLAQRLAADGLLGPRVDALLATLAPLPSQSPMGRKMLELYKSRFMPKPPSVTPPTMQYYKGVVTEQNARLCRDFVAEHKLAFSQAQARFGVPSSVAVALLFVETRLGKILADVPENALFTLASMAVSRQPDDISQWLPRMPGYEEHLPWFDETMPKRADWAYKEVRALVTHILQDDLDPRYLPSSIYGAVGLCQFMPSNIAAYGADGDGDGKVDLFHVPDAVASLSNYLARHGWKPGINRAQQHKVLMAYNKSVVYANTILALADLVAKPAAPVKADGPGTPGKTAPKAKVSNSGTAGQGGKALPKGKAASGGVPSGSQKTPR